MDNKDIEKNDIRYTKYGWIDFSHMIKRKNGLINWKKSINCIIPFRYKDIESNIIVKEYVSSGCVIIDIDGYQGSKKITTASICENNLAGCLGFYTMKHRYSVGDIVNGYIILEQIYRQKGKYNEKAYVCKCIIDGYINVVAEDKLKILQGCPVCNNKVVLQGVNDIATTNPELAQYFADINDAYSHTLHSNKKALLRCKNCGTEKEYIIKELCEQGFSCPQCGDKLSYGSKYVFNFLKQLFHASDIKPEHKFEWSICVSTSFKPEGKKMIYDFYIPMFNMIIEVHGIQHYEECGLSQFFPLENNKENDRAKKQIAIDNGIYYYIELDCRKSNPDHIKDSIINSDLPNIFGFCSQDIDWKECDYNATNSAIFETSKLWNRCVFDIIELASYIGVHPETIRRYLKRANSLNLLTTPYPLPKQSKSKSKKSS